MADDVKGDIVIPSYDIHYWLLGALFLEAFDKQVHIVQQYRLLPGNDRSAAELSDYGRPGSDHVLDRRKVLSHPLSVLSENAFDSSLRRSP